MTGMEPGVLLAFMVAMAGALGSFFAVKFAAAETQRLLKALHTRFDELAKEVRKMDVDLGRHDERIKALKESQRFKLDIPESFKEGK